MAKLEDIAVELIGGKASSDHLSETARKYMNGETTIDELRDQILLVLHKIGIVGVNSPLKKALLTGFHSTAKHIAAKAVSPSSETMRTI